MTEEGSSRSLAGLFMVPPVTWTAILSTYSDKFIIDNAVMIGVTMMVGWD